MPVSKYVPDPATLYVVGTELTIIETALLITVAGVAQVALLVKEQFMLSPFKGRYE
jgi:hypothetical protein